MAQGLPTAGLQLCNHLVHAGPGSIDENGIGSPGRRRVGPGAVPEVPFHEIPVDMVKRHVKPSGL